MSDPVNVDDLAARLIAAVDNRTGIEALTTTAGAFDVATAYRVQDALVADRIRRGNVLVGACLFGDTADGAWYFDLVREGRDVAELRDTLVFGQEAVA